MLSTAEKIKLKSGIYALSTGYMLSMIWFIPIYTVIMQVAFFDHIAISQMTNYRAMMGCLYMIIFLIPFITGYYYRIKCLMYSVIVPFLFFIIESYLIVKEKDVHAIMLLSSSIGLFSILIGLAKLAVLLPKTRQFPRLFYAFIGTFGLLLLSGIALALTLFCKIYFSTNVLWLLMTGLTGITVAFPILIFLSSFTIR